MSFGSGGGTGGSISQSSDVSINGVSNSQVLSYHAATSKWQNKALSDHFASRLPLNFRDFGGVGNGVVDDAPALNAFLAHLVATGSVGYLPNGHYVLDRPIIGPAGTGGASLVGESAQGVLLDFRSTGYASSATVFSWVTVRNFELRNLTIDGRLSTHGRLGHGISWRNAQNCVIDNVHVRNYGNSGIILFANNEDIGSYGDNTISNSTVDGMNVANNGVLFVNMHNCKFINVDAYNGGMSSGNSPSCGIQFKNRCINSHAVNVNAYHWKSGLTMGGDTPALGSQDCTMQGNAYDCNYAVLIGKSTNNYIDASSHGSQTNAVHFAQDASDNVVDINITNVPSGQTPISHGFHHNWVNVRYLPSSVSTLVRFGAGTTFNKVVVMGHAGPKIAPASMVDNMASATNNWVGTIDSLFDLNSVSDSGAPILRFGGPAGSTHWISVNQASNYMNFRVDGADRMILRATSLTSGLNGSSSLGTQSNAWNALYLQQPNGVNRKVSINNAGELVVE